MYRDRLRAGSLPKIKFDLGRPFCLWGVDQQLSEADFSHERVALILASICDPVTTPWTRAHIRFARLAPLRPLLEKRALPLGETGGGNFAVRTFPGLIVKDSYWRWPERGLQGNTIDFCTQVLRLSFHQAMRELTAS